jgi:hypothetical protein
MQAGIRMGKRGVGGRHRGVTRGRLTSWACRYADGVMWLKLLNSKAKASPYLRLGSSSAACMWAFVSTKNEKKKLP